MPIVKYLAKKQISRQLFKVCRMHGFETRSQIVQYFQKHGSFDGLNWINAEDIAALERLINADLLRLGLQWKLPEDLLRSQSLVKIAAFLLEQDLLPRKQMNLLKASAKIYQNTRLRTLYEMAPEFGMPEVNLKAVRTRSIAVLVERLRGLQVLKEDLQQAYDLDLSSSLIHIDKSWARQVNEASNTRFSPEFLGLLFGTYLEKDYALLGRPGEVLAGNYLGHRHYWSGFYLLRKDLAAAINFDAFLSETYRLLNNGSKGSRSLHFETFVSHFRRDSGDWEPEVLLPEVVSILYRELRLQVTNGNIIFPEQGTLLLRSYCREALIALGEPATRGRIRNRISELHPEVYVDLAGFGSVMLAEHGFTSFRHVFGLREWYPDGGGSLKLQDGRLLKELQEKFPVRWGEYWDSYWKENWQALMDFANTHSRLPKNGATREEAFLKKFLKMQVSRCGRGILDPEYQALLNELRSRYPHNNKVHWKVDWDERFNKVKAYAEVHGVPPSWKGTGEEKTLNGWLQSQRMRRKQGNLDRRQVLLLNHFDELYHQKSTKHFQRHWEKRYQELVAFGKLHSRLPREVIAEEKSLNRWYAAQRLRMSKGTLERRQYFLIQDIIAQYPLMDLDYRKDYWHEKCGELERFVEAHSRLPKSTIKEEIPLYKWLQERQLQGKRGKLDEQQLARLEKLISFKVPGHFEKHFDERFEELERFVTVHSRLPKRSLGAEDSLYNWFKVQRQRASAGKLLPRQQKPLQELCEPHLPVKTDWKVRFREVRIFAETHGRLPKRTALTKEEKVLNRWFMVQKDRLKRGTLVRRERKLIEFLIKRYGTGPGGHKLKPQKVMLGD